MIPLEPGDQIYLKRKACVDYVDGPLLYTDSGHVYGLRELDIRYNWEVELEDKMADSAVGKKISLRDLKQGDVITVTRDLVVDSVDRTEGIVTEKDTRAKIRLEQPLFGTDLKPVFSAVLKEREEKVPVHWPPQIGDKWRTGVGVEYLISKTSYTRKEGDLGHLTAVPDDQYNGYKLDMDTLKTRNPVLAYRKGNSLNF